MKRWQSGRDFISQRLWHIFLGGGLILAAFLMLVSASASSGEEISLSVSFRGLKLNTLLQWQTVPLSGTFEVMAGDTKLGEITANRTQEQQKAGFLESLPVNRQDAQLGLSLRPVMESMPGAYVCQDVIPVAWNGEDSLRADVLAYAREGLFLLDNTHSESGHPLGGASFAVLNADGQAVLSFSIGQDGTYRSLAPLPEGVYTLRQTLSPEGTVPAGDVSFEIVPYLGTEDSVTGITVQNVPVPLFSRLSGAMVIETKPTGDLYAEDQTAEFRLSSPDIQENTIPLQHYAVDIGNLVLLDHAGVPHPDQTGKELRSISVTPGMEGMQAKVRVFDENGQMIGNERNLASGQKLSLDGLKAVSARIVYYTDDGQPFVPERFVLGDISLQVGLARRMPEAGKASVARIGITVKQAWQYQYPDRDGTPVTAYGEGGSIDLGVRVLDSRAVMHVSAVANAQGRVMLTVDHEGGPQVDNPRLAVRLPDGWRIQDNGFAAPVVAVSHGEQADIAVLTFSGSFIAGQTMSVEFAASFGAGDGAGAVWIMNETGVVPTLDNPDGLLLWGERQEGCPVADAALGLSQPATYAYDILKAENKSGKALSLQPLGFASGSGEAALNENGYGELLFKTGDVPSVLHMVILPQGIKLRGMPQGQVFITTDQAPQPASVWVDAELFAGDWTQVTALSMKAGAEAILPVHVSRKSGTVQVPTLVQTPQWAGESAYLADEEGSLSLKIGKAAALSGRMFDDANGNGRMDDYESGAAGQLVLWRGLTNISYHCITNVQGAFDFSGVSIGSQMGELYAKLPDNTAIAGQPGLGGMYLAAQTDLHKRKDVQIAFTKMCSLYGRVYEQENQVGVVGAEIALLQKGQAVASAVTDAQGQYSFNGLIAGDYQVMLKLLDTLSSQAGFYPGDGYVQAEGLTALLPAITMPYGGEISQNAPVRRLGSLKVKLLGYTYPLGTASLYLDGALIADSAPDDTGSYYFDKLFNGAYTLSFQVPQGLAIKTEGMQAWQKGLVELVVQVPAGEARQLAVEETVTGKLLIQFNGSGLTDIPVTMTGPEDRQGLMDENGQCLFADLIPGLYQVNVILPRSVLADQSGVWQMELLHGSVTASLSVDILPGQDTMPQAAMLLQTAAVLGYVFDDPDRDGDLGAGEAPLDGVMVSLLAEQNGTWAQVQSVQTGVDGQYRFDYLTPGQYRLSITLPIGKALADLRAEEPFLLESGQNLQVLAGAVSPGTLVANAFWDSNNDGLQGIYERAIEGTLVEVYPMEGGNAVAEGETNRNGQVSFGGITPGSYYIRFTLPEGYWLSQQGDVSGLKRNTVPMADSRQGTTEPFTLLEGQTEEFGVGGIKTGLIRGRIWRDTNEDGIMDDDEPGLAGCEITLLGSRGGKSYAYTTDDTGRYEVIVRTDSYLFTVKGPSGMSFTRFSLTGGVNRSIITTEGVGAGERRYTFESGTREENQNIGFVPGVILEGVAFLDSNYNGIWDDGEQLLSGVTLELTRSANAKALGSIVTGQEGAFRFDSLRGGEYSLRAVLPDTGVVFTRVPVSDSDYKNLFDQRTGRRETTVSLTMSSGERRAVGVGAVVPGSLSGSVFADINYNGLYDSGEKPVAGVLLRLLDQEGNMVAGVETDATGQYTFGGLMPMAYTLAVEKPAGYMFTKLSDGEYRSRVQVMKKNEGFTEVISVALGERVTGVYAGVILPAGVQGQVFADANDDGLLSPGESGFENVLVSLLNESRQEVKSFTTGADGSFTFADLHPGRYILSYLLPEDTVYAAKAAGGSDVYSEDLTAFSDAFDLSIGETKRVPLCGAVALGRLSGTAFHDGNANGIKEEGEGTLSGVRIILISRRTGQEAASMLTGMDGVFMLDRLRPGMYTLNVSLPPAMVFTRAGANILMQPSLEAKGSLDIDIPMGERLDGCMVGGTLPASLQGHVWLDENNNGLQEPEEALLSGLSVQVLDTLTGSVFTELTTDENGSYHVPVIQPGTYKLTVSLPQNSIAADTGAGENMFHDGAPGYMILHGLTLLEGEEISEIRAGVKQYTSVEGTVWADEQGSIIQLAGTQVSLYSADDTMTPLKMVTTGEDGAYRFDQLMPGEYRIGAELPQGYLFVKPDDARLTSKEVVSVIEDTASGLSYNFLLNMGEDQAMLDIGAVKTGKLGDYAWLDENGNGLQDAGEPGIPGLIVILVQDGQQVASAKTDAHGYYLFDNVYPMVSQVQVSMYPELVPAVQRIDYPLLVSALTGSQGDTAYTGDVMVTSGGRNFDCDLGFVLKSGSKRPGAIVPPPAQKWD